MSQHTPGPWSVHGDRKTLIGSDDQKMMLAEVLFEHVCTEWGRPIEVAQDNARLIAAAPELLDACRAIIKTCPGTPMNAAAQDAKYAALYKAAAAIAKATGA